MLTVFFSSALLSAQTCGFGCLGLSGFYGGYSYQQYSADGLNEALANTLSSLDYKKEPIKFNEAYGFRVGANIFRANFDSYFFTAKGFYQFLKDEQQVAENAPDGNPLLKSTLELNHWGVGVDFGIPIFHFLNWKIVEGGVTFHTTDLTNEFNFDGRKTGEEKYNYNDVAVGYFVGTGLVLHLVKDYVSLEGTAVYNNIRIDDLSDQNGNSFLGSSSSARFIERGGVSATVQLNIGVPL